MLFQPSKNLSCVYYSVRAKILKKGQKSVSFLYRQGEVGPSGARRRSGVGFGGRCCGWEAEVAATRRRVLEETGQLAASCNAQLSRGPVGEASKAGGAGRRQRGQAAASGVDEKVDSGDVALKPGPGDVTAAEPPLRPQWASENGVQRTRRGEVLKSLFFFQRSEEFPSASLLPVSAAPPTGGGAACSAP